MEEFRNALSRGGLSDLGWRGNKYTWSNGHSDGSFVKERLDRAVANQEWRRGYSRVEVETLVAWSSDHLPILLSCYNDNTLKGRFERPFRYEMSWDQENECGDTVKEVWKEEKRKRGSLLSVQRCLKSCSQALRKWYMGKNSMRGSEIKRFSEKLKELKEDEGPLNVDEIRQVNRKLEELLEQENCWWRQRAKAHWLQLGDRNTKFFHASASQRKKKNSIVEIADVNGFTVRRHEDIEEAFGEYFTGV
ncbi:uncharacterized protein LOC108995126, partial [Juglans regia]|uniref:Uncharacterized protein LOC108995126 n=2 Tax=Juglans regia TaxID=51240 RepID=A0A2I4F3E3_JUGRE